MHEEAEYGVAAHWLYKRGRSKKGDDEWVQWVKTLMDWQGDDQDAAEYMRTLRTDLFDDEVYVFTPKGEVKTLPPARRRSTSPTPSTRTSATRRSARRSTAASCRSTTSSRTATSSRS
jgi:GTP pyrophosphokinase